MPLLTVRCPMGATVVDLPSPVGTVGHAGDVVAIVESMKLEHEVRAATAGRVASLAVARGDVVEADAALLRIDTDGATAPATARVAASPDTPTAIRADLAAARARHALTRDDARPDAVAKRHALGLRTARENVDDLCDDGSFVEYGALAVAAQRARRSADDLARNTPADGMVTERGW